MNISKNEFFRQITVRICGSLDIKTAMESAGLDIEPGATLVVSGAHDQAREK